MKFHPTNFEGLWIIELKPVSSPLGYLARSYSEAEFQLRGLNIDWPECNETLTKKVGSLRGMHWQRSPHGEIKLVRCLRGRVFDVVVDIRRGSSTFGQHQAFELSDTNLRQLYIPQGFAHGFQALSDDCMLHYQMGAKYRPELSDGIRWDDPDLGIAWPQPVTVISERDTQLRFLHDVTIG